MATIAGMLLLCRCTGFRQAETAVPNPVITWDSTLTLPPYAGMDPHKGLAGAFTGFVGGDIIIAGGANFPESFPWEGGAKHWWSTLYRLNPSTGQYAVYDIFLEQPRAYGVSIQLPEGILCIGGNDADCCYASLFLITEGEERGDLLLVKDPWPPLPVPLSNMAGTRLNRKVYIAGGQESMHPEESTRHFYVLDLDNPDKGWSELPAWPGADRAYSVCVAQAGKIYLFGGRSFGPGRDMTVHPDGFVFDPSTETWMPLEGIYPVMAGTALPVGDSKILFFGGVETLIPGSPAHPGFSRTVRTYDVVSGTLDSLTVSPFPLAVTTTALRQNDTVYIPSGEVRPGIRTPRILRADISSLGM